MKYSSCRTFSEESQEREEELREKVKKNEREGEDTRERGGRTPWGEEAKLLVYLVCSGLGDQGAESPQSQPACSDL